MKNNITPKRFSNKRINRTGAITINYVDNKCKIDKDNNNEKIGRGSALERTLA